MKITYHEHEGGIADEPRTIDVPAAVLDWPVEYHADGSCDVCGPGFYHGCECEQP